MTFRPPRGIAVVDVGSTNTKVVLYSPELAVVAERRTTSPRIRGSVYTEIDLPHIIAFAAAAISELDQILPVDTIVPTTHGAAVIILKQDGTLAVPAMDYMAEPPREIVEDYLTMMPSFEETWSPLLPKALLHSVQLLWQQRAMPNAFAEATTILPLIQYVAFALGGRPVSEVSSLSCQSHLVDMKTGGPSSLARKMGWADKYAPPAKAWEVVGGLKPGFRGSDFRGRGDILAGVHDSTANFLRYQAAGLQNFTLLSTGTWIIGFDTDADMNSLDHTRDIVANKSIFGQTIACSRFFGGKEFEVIAGNVPASAANLACAAALVKHGIMPLPSFTDSGGPMPGTGGKGKIVGDFNDNPEARATLASLYCALMVSESLDALHSRHDVIVDGPFSQNSVFLDILSALRPLQRVFASAARDGTPAGAACLALMPDGTLPEIAVDLRLARPTPIAELQSYQQHWRSLART